MNIPVKSSIKEEHIDAKNGTLPEDKECLQQIKAMHQTLTGVVALMNCRKIF